MTQRMIMIGAAALACVASGCISPKVLASHAIVGDKGVKYIYQQTAQLSGGIASNGQAQQDEKLFDYSVSICDYAEDGTATNCRETRLLENVTLTAQ